MKSAKSFSAKLAVILSTLAILGVIMIHRPPSAQADDSAKAAGSSTQLCKPYVYNPWSPEPGPVITYKTTKDTSGLYSWWDAQINPRFSVSSWPCEVKQSARGQVAVKSVLPIEAGCEAYSSPSVTYPFEGTVTYRSSDPAVVSIDSAGHYHALAAGTAVIYPVAHPSKALTERMEQLTSNMVCPDQGVAESTETNAAFPVTVLPESHFIYRLYNPNSGEHFYTASRAEEQSLWREGWVWELNGGWYAPNSQAGRLVYRLYNPVVGDHFYTASGPEKTSLLKAGWRDEGIAFYSDTASQGSPVYRAYNPHARAGSHNYTTSGDEQRNLVKHGWKDEGVAWYAYKP